MLTLKWSRVSSTIFGKLDLSNTQGLEQTYHLGPSIIGMDTIFLSKGKIHEGFLKGCGLSDLQLKILQFAKPGLKSGDATQIGYDLINMYNGQGIRFYSCFISYNNRDKKFAKKLYDELQENGVRCWFAQEDMKIGDRIRPRIDQEIRIYEKFLVILSYNSIDSEWVGDEVEAALEEETNNRRNILFPIRLDDAILETQDDWAAKIKRRRHIGDFSGWQDEAKYQKAFERLLRDLKSTGGG